MGLRVKGTPEWLCIFTTLRYFGILRPRISGNCTSDNQFSQISFRRDNHDRSPEPRVVKRQATRFQGSNARFHARCRTSRRQGCNHDFGRGRGAGDWGRGEGGGGRGRIRSRQLEVWGAMSPGRSPWSQVYCNKVLAKMSAEKGWRTVANNGEPFRIFVRLRPCASPLSVQTHRVPVVLAA